MNEAAAALVRRRARNLLVFVPLTALTVGAATTQFVAWKLNYTRLRREPENLPGR
jgi:hypothetical protein